jgi:hypothetical protein
LRAIERKAKRRLTHLKLRVVVKAWKAALANCGIRAKRSAIWIRNLDKNTQSKSCEIESRCTS